MRNRQHAYAIIVLLLTTLISGCMQRSEHVQEASAGPNGGFEHVKSGVPVNWLVYSPQTVPNGDFELIIDREDYKQGQQSLRFLVHECSAEGGWFSPGLTQEYPAVPGETYLVSYWIKNEGCDYAVSVGGVDAKFGAMSAIDTGNDSASWTQVEHTYVVPERYDNIRFELSIRSPGSLWIDDVRIEPVG